MPAHAQQRKFAPARTMRAHAAQGTASTRADAHARRRRVARRREAGAGAAAAAAGSGALVGESTHLVLDDKREEVLRAADLELGHGTVLVLKGGEGALSRE